MRHSPAALFRCATAALLLLLCLCSPAAAAEKKDPFDTFVQKYLPHVLGAIAAVIVVGGGTIWVLYRRSAAAGGADAHLPPAAESKKTLLRTVVEPGLIFLAFCVVMYVAYPFISKVVEGDKREGDTPRKRFTTPDLADPNVGGFGASRK